MVEFDKNSIANIFVLRSTHDHWWPLSLLSIFVSFGWHFIYCLFKGFPLIRSMQSSSIYRRFSQQLYLFSTGTLNNSINFSASSNFQNDNPESRAEKNVSFNRYPFNWHWFSKLTLLKIYCDLNSLNSLKNWEKNVNWIS